MSARNKQKKKKNSRYLKKPKKKNKTHTRVPKVPRILFMVEPVGFLFGSSYLMN